jgi:hypothetical protein
MTVATESNEGTGRQAGSLPKEAVRVLSSGAELIRKVAKSRATHIIPQANGWSFVSKSEPEAPATERHTTVAGASGERPSLLPLLLRVVFPPELLRRLADDRAQTSGFVTRTSEPSTRRQRIRRRLEADSRDQHGIDQVHLAVTLVNHHRPSFFRRDENKVASDLEALRRGGVREVGGDGAYHHSQK